MLRARTSTNRRISRSARLCGAAILLVVATAGLLPASAYADEPPAPPQNYPPGYPYDVIGVDSVECFVRGESRLGRSIWVLVPCEQTDPKSAGNSVGPDNLFVWLESRIERFPGLNNNIKSPAAAYSSSYGAPATLPAGFLATATALYVFEPSPNPHWVNLGNTGWSYSFWSTDRWAPAWHWGSQLANKWYFIDGWAAQLTFGGWQVTNATTPVLFHGCWFCLGAGPSEPPPPAPSKKDLAPMPPPPKPTPFGN